MVKKLLLALILLIFAIPCSYGIESGFIDYQEQEHIPIQKSETILVLPLDFGYFNNQKSIYSEIVNNISGDIVNVINKSQQLRAMPLYNLNYKVKQNKLEPDFKKIINTYKSKAIVDYMALRIMCDILHTDKVLMVSGEFDPSQFVFKPLNTLEAIPAAMIKPAYQVNTLITLVDPYEEEVLWERYYQKSFMIDAPLTSFERNPISLKSLNNYSRLVSNSVLRNISTVMLTPEPVTSVESYVVNTTTRPKDGVTTKDGHSFSTINRFVKTTKKKYSEWEDSKL